MRQIEDPAGTLTFVRHLRASLQIKLLAGACADPLDVIAKFVAAVLATV